MSPEKFRQRFITDKKEPADNWRSHGFQLKTYFNEWVSGMNVINFEKLILRLVKDNLKEKYHQTIKLSNNCQGLRKWMYCLRN